MANDSLRRMLITALALATAFGVAGWYWSVQRNAERALVYTIPAGTLARMGAGEHIDVLPDTITLDLDEHNTLVIANQDVAAVTVGPFKIEPGQRFIQRYSNPGTFDLLCTLHGDERVRIVVTR